MFNLLWICHEKVRLKSLRASQKSKESARQKAKKARRAVERLKDSSTKPDLTIGPATAASNSSLEILPSADNFTPHFTGETFEEFRANEFEAVSILCCF